MTALDKALTENYGASVMNLDLERFLRILRVQEMLGSFWFPELTSKFNLLLRNVV